MSEKTILVQQIIVKLIRILVQINDNTFRTVLFQFFAMQYSHISSFL